MELKIGARYRARNGMVSSPLIAGEGQGYSFLGNIDSIKRAWWPNGQYISTREHAHDLVEELPSENELTPDEVKALRVLLARSAAELDRRPSLNVRRDYVKRVLQGDLEALYHAFTWRYTPQGEDHWAMVRASSGLSDADFDYVAKLLCK